MPFPSLRKSRSIRPFFRNHGLEGQARGLLGRSASGAAEVGEVLATFARISDEESWAAEFARTAQRVQDRAVAALAEGRLATASAAYLQAATYWACAVDGLTTGDDEPATLAAFRASRACWDAVVDTSGGRFLRVEVPYERRTLPGYLLRPDATGSRRPTLVMTNGSDGALSDLWGSGAAGALARGYNVFLYDGPGQQSMLFDQHTSFRRDWEAVLTPVVDALVARDDVDADQLMAHAISQGGYWLPRALAFEHRFVAAVIDPGVVDVAASWMANLNAKLIGMLDRGDRAGFNAQMRYAMYIPGVKKTLTTRGRPYAHADWFGLFTAVRAYRISPDVAARVRTPVLITDPENEQFWPGQSAELAALLPGRADLVTFTAAEGADGHCQPLARQLTDQRMFDWLTDRLADSVALAGVRPALESPER
jgi:hypothetical protein